MARVDYEAAWTDLGELIASREGWGSKTLAQEMARIAARRRVSEGLLERVLRIYGGRFQELFVNLVNSESPASGGNGSSPSPAAPGTPPTEGRGGRDGEQDREAAGRTT